MWERSNPFFCTCRPTERNLPLNCHIACFVFKRKLIWPDFSYKVPDLGVYSKEILTSNKYKITRCWLNALIMQHRDNYFVLYLHRYKGTDLTRSCFFLVYMFLYLIIIIIYCYLIEYLGFNKNYILPQKCLIALFCDYIFLLNHSEITI